MIKTETSGFKDPFNETHILIWKKKKFAYWIEKTLKSIQYMDQDIKKILELSPIFKYNLLWL